MFQEERKKVKEVSFKYLKDVPEKFGSIIQQMMDTDIIQGMAPPLTTMAMRYRKVWTITDSGLCH